MSTDLTIAAVILGTACLAGILWWLYRRWKLRKPPPKNPEPKP